MIKPWDLYDGQKVWFVPSNATGKRYAAVVDGEHRKLYEENVVALKDVDASYAQDYEIEARASVKYAPLDRLDPRDMIDELCALIKQAGLTMTLYGQPVSADELRAHAQTNVEERIVDLLTRKP